MCNSVPCRNLAYGAALGAAQFSFPGRLRAGEYPRPQCWGKAEKRQGCCWLWGCCGSRPRGLALRIVPVPCTMAAFVCACAGGGKGESSLPRRRARASPSRCLTLRSGRGLAGVRGENSRCASGASWAVAAAIAPRGPLRPRRLAMCVPARGRESERGPGMWEGAARGREGARRGGGALLRLMAAASFVWRKVAGWRCGPLAGEAGLAYLRAVQPRRKEVRIGMSCLAQPPFPYVRVSAGLLRTLHCCRWRGRVSGVESFVTQKLREEWGWGREGVMGRCMRGGAGLQRG